MIATGARAKGLGRAVSPARRAKDRVFTVALWAAGALAALPILFIAGYVVIRGAKALNASFFTQTAPPPGLPGGGMLQAFIGTGMIIGLATAASVPLGVLTA